MNREKVIKKIIDSLTYEEQEKKYFQDFLNNQVSIEEFVNYKKINSNCFLDEDDIRLVLDEFEGDEKEKVLIFLICLIPERMILYINNSYEDPKEIYRAIEKKLDLTKLVIKSIEEVRGTDRLNIINKKYLSKNSLWDYYRLEGLDDNKLDNIGKVIKYTYLLKYTPGIGLRYIDTIEEVIFEYTKEYIIKHGVNKSNIKERDYLINYISYSTNESKLKQFLNGFRDKVEKVEDIHKNIYNYLISEDYDHIFNFLAETTLNYSQVMKKVMLVLVINDYVCNTNFNLLKNLCSLKKPDNKAQLIISYFASLNLQAIYYYDYFCSQIPKDSIKDYLVRFIKDRVEFVKEGESGRLVPTALGKVDFDFLEKNLIAYKFSYFNDIYIEVTGRSYNNRNIRVFEDSLREHMINKLKMEEREVGTIIDYVIRGIGSFEEVEVKTYDRKVYYQISFYSSNSKLCEDVKKEDENIYSRFVRVFANKIYKNLYHTFNYSVINTFDYNNLFDYGFTNEEVTNLAIAELGSYYRKQSVKYLKEKDVKEVINTIDGGLSSLSVEVKEVIYQELFDGEKEIEIFFENIETSKRLKDIFIEKYSGNNLYEFSEKYIFDKKVDKRSNVIDLLITLGQEEKNIEVFEKLLEEEKAKRISEKLSNYIKSVKAFKVKREKVEDYLDFYNENFSGKVEKTLGVLPLLKDKDGKSLHIKYSQILVGLYIDFEFSLAHRLNMEFLKVLDKKSVEDLASYVYSIFKNNNFDNKIFDYIKSSLINMGSNGVEEVKKDIVSLSKGTKGLLASKIVGIFSYNEDETILAFVDYLIRKVKHKNVVDESIRAFEEIARLRGVTLEELEDNIIPNFSMNIRGEKLYSYGQREFKVTLLGNCNFEVLNLESGKVMKSLPKENSSEDVEVVNRVREEFKILKKQVKETYKLQLERLENTLAKQRYWTGERFVKTFIDNPLMREFAVSQIWARYEDGKVVETFRYSGDGTFMNHNGDDIEINNYINIGLLHPVEVEEDILEYWREDLEDYEIVQSFEQLNREVSLGELNVAFESVQGEKLNYGLLKEGWKRGEVLDGGVFYAFYLEDTSNNIGAELYHEGIPVGWYENEEVKLESLKFYNLDKVNKSSYFYEAIKDDFTIPFDKIPKRFYSEVTKSLKKYFK